MNRSRQYAITKTTEFSLKIFLAVVIAFSWPFQIAYLFLGENFRPLLLVSMVMTGVASYCCARFIFKDGYSDAGWSWGKPKHYVVAFLLALYLWLAPVVLEQFFGIGKAMQFSPQTLLTTFVLSFTITLLPAFGEEFSWRGYLLPRLQKQYTRRKALLLHGLITWMWHFPFIVGIARTMPGNIILTTSVVMLISCIPTIMHAIVFAYFWSVSKSVLVSTVYHSAFDEVRDTLQNSVGFGSLVDIWQMSMLTILGILLLWKGRWEKEEIKEILR